MTAALAGWLWLVGPATLGGQTTYVTTYGESMEPQFRAGDLAVLRPASNYVVAYHSDLLQTTVMHRVAGFENGLYTFKGDNNSWLDPEQLTKEKLIGKLALQVPQGGLWPQSLTSLPVLGLIAFALIASGGTATTTRHRRKRRKEVSMSRHTRSNERTVPVLALTGLPPALQAAAAVTAITGILAATLGVLAWSGPLEEPSVAEVNSGTQMAFSYTADVGRSPAYDGTTAVSPDPIFRKLTNAVDVMFAYSGAPGSIAVAAELSTQDG